MVSRLFVYNAPTGKAAARVTEALFGHRLRSSRQLQAKQPRCLLARPNMVTSAKKPPVERLALPPRARADPNPPSGRTSDQRCALGAPSLDAKHEGRARQPGPALPRSGPLARVPSATPSPSFGLQALDSTSAATFPLIPP